MRPKHKNPWGHPCSCPWFKGGHTHKHAAKIDWLRERPDVQKDLRKRLIVEHSFPTYPPEADPLLPWVLREYGKGRVEFNPNVEERIRQAEAAAEKYNQFISQGSDPDSPMGRELNEHAHQAMEIAGRTVRAYGLHVEYQPVDEYMPGFAKMLEDQKRRGQGIDLMQHDFPSIRDQYNDWHAEQEEKRRQELLLNNGQIVHKFPDDWTVRRLRNPEECDLEGELMGHCVGSYGNEAERGHTNIFSLRDARNHPHATMEAHGPHGMNPEDPTEWIIPAHAWDELPMEKFKGVPIEDIRAVHDDRYGRYNQPAADVYPEFMKRAVEGGTAMPPLAGGQVDQTYGKEDSAPLPKYTERLNEFLHPHGLQSSPEPWWDDYYEMEGPQNFRELLGSNGDNGIEFGHHGYPQEEWYDGEPDEYRNAISDAEEQGLNPPELQVGNPDYERILKDLIDPEPRSDWERGGHVLYKPWEGYNPAAGEYVLNHAAQNGHDLRYDLESHIDDAGIQPYQPDPALYEIPDPFQRQKVMDAAEKEYYETEYHGMKPWIQMFNHLGPKLIPGYQPATGYQPSTTVTPGLGVGEQRQLWDPETGKSTEGIQRSDGGNNYSMDQIPSVFSKLAHSLYERWVYSPATEQVTLSNNNEDPLDVRYHGDLAREINEPGLIHGFAYRIGNGWRLFDWESNPITDTRIISRVIRQLQGSQPASGPENSSQDWEPDYQDQWDRMHQGMPT